MGNDTALGMGRAGDTLVGDTSGIAEERRYRRWGAGGATDAQRKGREHELPPSVAWSTHAASAEIRLHRRTPRADHLDRWECTFGDRVDNRRDGRDRCDRCDDEFVVFGRDGCHWFVHESESVTDGFDGRDESEPLAYRIDRPFGVSVSFTHVYADDPKRQG
jgi:hypothetical protein